jgi:hypothetical protein
VQESGWEHNKGLTEDYSYRINSSENTDVLLKMQNGRYKFCIWIFLTLSVHDLDVDIDVNIFFHE